MVEQGRPEMTMWPTRIACWITKATDTNSKYGIPIACPLQQFLHNYVSMLRYPYAVSLTDNERPKSTEHNTKDHMQSHAKTVLKHHSEYFTAARLQTR